MASQYYKLVIVVWLKPVIHGVTSSGHLFTLTTCHGGGILWSKELGLVTCGQVICPQKIDIFFIQSKKSRKTRNKRGSKSHPEGAPMCAGAMKPLQCHRVCVCWCHEASAVPPCVCAGAMKPLQCPHVCVCWCHETSAVPPCVCWCHEASVVPHVCVCVLVL